MLKIISTLAALLTTSVPPNNACLAFRPVRPGGRGRPPSPPVAPPPATRASPPEARGRGRATADASPDGPGGRAPVPRRSALISLVAAGASPSALVVVPPPSDAAAAAAGVAGGARSPARIESWPGIESLEPLHELRLSLDAIATGVEDRRNWPYIRRRLEKFFGGFVINEKNYYMGVGLQYMNEVRYDPAELPNYVLMDKEARYDALDGTMRGLEGLKTALAGDDADAAKDLAEAARGSLGSFFALIPEGDVRAVEELFANVKKADVNGDGRLSDDEMAFLSPADQETWRRRVGKFG